MLASQLYKEACRQWCQRRVGGYEVQKDSFALVNPFKHDVQFVNKVQVWVQFEAMKQFNFSQLLSRKKKISGVLRQMPQILAARGPNHQLLLFRRGRCLLPSSLLPPGHYGQLDPTKSVGQM